MPPIPPEQRTPYGVPAPVNVDNPRPHLAVEQRQNRKTVDPPESYGALTAVNQADPSSPHLTMDELARRWRRKRKTIERHYAKWGLRPLRFGGRLLFPISQILEVEQRAMRGEFVEARP
jgi:hypothetical protein